MQFLRFIIVIFRMDGCKLIIEYEVDCTFEFAENLHDKGKVPYLGLPGKDLFSVLNF